MDINVVLDAIVFACVIVTTVGLIWTFIKICNIEDALSHVSYTVANINSTLGEIQNEEIEVDCPFSEDIDYPIGGDFSFIEDDDCEECGVVEELEQDVHLISHTQFKFDHTYGHSYVLKYNEHTDKLTYSEYDGDEYNIDNVAEVVGDALLFFGVCSDSPNSVYVRNHNYKCDIKIEKVG